MAKSTRLYFAQNGVWICPPSITEVLLIGCGGGGGGGCGDAGVSSAGTAATSTGGGGGGGGALQNHTFVTVIPGTAYTITIGSGGTGATVQTSSGVAGSSTIFASSNATIATFPGASGGGSVNTAGGGIGAFGGASIKLNSTSPNIYTPSFLGNSTTLNQSPSIGNTGY